MADLIFYNGTIHTMAGDSGIGSASAIAVSGHLIEAVGTDQDILSLADAHTRVIDLNGKCIVPGFTDTHCHVLFGGLEKKHLDLSSVRSIEEIVERGRKYIEDHNIPEGTWILGGGYDHNIFDDPRQPERSDLDRISTRHPIMVERVCGHIGSINSLAFELTGFDRSDFTFEGGGGVERGEDGRANGVLVETALDLIKLHIPPPSEEMMKEAVLAIFKEAASFGVTAMHTNDADIFTLPAVINVYKAIKEEGKATVRIWEEVQTPRMEELRSFLALGLRTGSGDPFFKIGCIKLFTDGSLGARTAYMKEDYADAPGNRGVSVYSQEELNEIVLAAHENGMQIGAHAIGDEAAMQCARAFQAAYDRDGRDLRNRIIHCQFADAELLDLMKNSHTCADIQPPFLASDLPIIPKRLGERDRIGYVWKSLSERGILCGGGSDHPVESFNPIWGIHCAVNRTDSHGLPCGGWHPEQKLSAEEALRLYTINGALLSMEEDVRGSLEKGKYADFAVLDKDICAVPPSQICTVRNCMTVMNGKIIFSS